MADMTIPWDIIPRRSGARRAPATRPRWWPRRRGRGEDGGEREPLAGQPVLGAKGVLAVDDALDEAALLEPLETAGEEPGRDAGQGGEELAEPALAEGEGAGD